MAQRRNSYKEPIFLFTSSSMRQAAWAGWYSALGNKEMAEKYIPEKRLKEIINRLFKTIKAEIKRKTLSL